MNAELLYLKVDKVNSDGTVTEGVAFPSDTEQVVLGTYTYEAKRMGGAPTITDSFYFSRCLDKEWKSDENNSEVYAEYNGERFYVSSIPSPTKDNTNGLYKHEITLTSRREILDNTLFFDVVTEHTDTQDKDRYRSNQTNFSFGGDIREFIKRINDSLVYVGIYDPTKEEGKQGYHLVLKDGYGTDDVKEISIDSQYITEVIQEIYNTYNLTYYWKGEVCYVGEYENDLTSDDNVVRYGRNDALLSVSEENSNNKIVDMITGYGSSDNIPYYYPNDGEFGEAVFETENLDKKNVLIDLTRLFKFGDPIGKKFTFCKVEAKEYNNTFNVSEHDSFRGTADEYDNVDSGTLTVSVSMKCTANCKIKLSNLNVRHYFTQEDNSYVSVSFGSPELTLVKNGISQVLNELNDNFVCDEDGTYEIIYSVSYQFGLSERLPDGADAGYAVAECEMEGNITISYDADEKAYFVNDDFSVPYDKCAITFLNLDNVTAAKCGYKWDNGWIPTGVKDDGNAAKVAITDRIWLDPSQNLMPSIYRESKGVERFYYALNDTHKIPGSDKYYEFKNKYVKGNPHQGSVSFDDIKPTINGIRNDVIQSDGLGQLFGEIADVAFDSKDSDVKDSNDEYVHQYFYIKLHKFSGEFGFDLFSHALASENAVINMIDCQGCPACAFPIQSIWNANKDKCYNCVSVDENGNLKTINTEKDDYILGETAAQSDKLNQNSQEKEIWIAVQKDSSTLGIVMPNAAGNFKPKRGDKFVITGIKPPKVLVTAAEHRLDEALIKYMSENNEDSFTYSIKFSRIFLAENPDYANKLNENAKICLEFNGVKHELFVSNYSVKRDGNALAEVDVELVKSLEATQSEMKQMIDSVKGDVMNSIGGLNTGSNNSFNSTVADKIYLSKLKDDTAQGTLTFEKIQKFLTGLQLGSFTNMSGGDWSMDEDGRSHLITDYLEVRMKAFFEELVIKKTSTIGGKELISPAGSNVISDVEEVTVTYDGVSQTAYRCYFLAEQDGEEVDNDWAVGDQARSESFNVKAGTYHKAGNHFFWRLVIGCNDTDKPVEREGKKYHYIDISSLDYATASDVPVKGDVVNQCGNRTDITRQNCLVLSAVDTYSPSITLYHGINSYSFSNKEYVEYGVVKSTGKAFFNVYGDAYIGDRPTSANNYEGDSYIKYDSDKKKVVIKAELSIDSTVGDKTLDKYIEGKAMSEEQVNKLINNSQVISDLQNQIDGAIETWFYDGVPTLSNVPASEWKTDADKNIHLGDLYYDNKTGKAYRFALDGSAYTWTVITDTDITKALSDAAKAQETADGKMTVFSSQPTPPYQTGDIWVNATYPASTGATYKNDVLRCKTAKGEGKSFDIADWMLASKYTDDTVANEAKAAAELAQKNIKTTQENLKNLGGTVTENKNAFDKFTEDGYLDSSEIAAMAQDSKRLEDDFAAAEKSYDDVVSAEVLMNTNQLTDLQLAYATMKTAKEDLVSYLSDIVTRYNASDADGKQAINAAVANKYTQFSESYDAFYNKLGLANAYITSTIYGKLMENITDTTGLNYLKTALAQKSDIKGGLFLTSMIALRDGDNNIQSGINGVPDSTAKGNGIATWWGGEAVDKDYNDGSVAPAVSIIRFDGSGYFANGAISWDTEGNLTANPMSFIINKQNLGAYLAFFKPTWKGTDTSSADQVSYLKPCAPFSELTVLGDTTIEGGVLKIGGAYLVYKNGSLMMSADAKGEKALNVFATGGISAYGSSSASGAGGGLNGSIIPYATAINMTTSDESTEVASAWSIKKLSDRIKEVSSAIPSISVEVPTTGNAITGASYDEATGKLSFTKGTFLTSQSLSAYLKSEDAAKTYAPVSHKHTKSDITDMPTDLGDFTNTAGFTKNTGTVTSVKLTAPTGFTVTNGTVTTSGTIALGFATGYSLPSDAKQKNWTSAYDWYKLMTTDEETADGVINKWNEVVSFLAGIKQTDTLDGIVDGINTSITDEVTRAKKAEEANADNITANAKSITTLKGYFDASGNAKKALQLTNARKLWGNSFNGTADISGNITMQSTDGTYIQIGGVRLVYDEKNTALKVVKSDGTTAANLYATGGVSAYGSSSISGSGGGLNGNVLSYESAKALTSNSDETTQIASAWSIKKLYDEISNLDLSGSAKTSISATTSGSGNAITSASYDSETGKFTFTKGSTFALSSHTHNYLSKLTVGTKEYSVTNNGITIPAYPTTLPASDVYDWAKATTKPTYTASEVGAAASSHTHSVKINGSTKTIAATGGTAVDLGTYLTAHQSLADYLKSADAAKTYLGISAKAADSDKLDGWHLNDFYDFTTSRDFTKGTLVKTSIDFVSSRAFLLEVKGNGYSGGLINFMLQGYVYGTTLDVLKPSCVCFIPGCIDSIRISAIDGKLCFWWKRMAYWQGFNITCKYVQGNNKNTVVSVTDADMPTGTFNKDVTPINTINSSNIGSQSVASAAKLATARTINGTSFNGTADITTTKWGTARNVGIVNSDGTGTAVTVSVDGSANVNLKLPSTIKASLTGNADTATKLKTARTLWGQSFDGSGNVSGLLTLANGNHGALKMGTAYLSSNGGRIVMQNTTALRFSTSDAWDYNQWAGLKYDHANKTIHLGLADGSVFTANTAQSGGTLSLPGIQKVTLGGVTLEYDSTNKALKVNGSLYATGGITAYGEGSASGSGGLNGSVLSYSDAIKQTSEDTSKLASAYSIAKLKSLIDSIDGSALTEVDWSIIKNKPSSFTPSSHTHTFASLTSKPTSLSGFGITDGVNSVSVSGSGNAVTSASISNHTLTLTKGSTFLEAEGWWYSGDAHNANDLHRGITFAYSSHSNTATTGTLVDFTCSTNSNYPFQLQSSYNGDNLYYRRRNGDNGTWGSWKRLARAEEIPSLSNYVTLNGSQTISALKTFSLSSFGAISIKRTDDTNGAAIQFRGSNNIYGYIGFNGATKDKQLQRWSVDTNSQYDILDSSTTSLSGNTVKINSTSKTFLSSHQSIYSLTIQKNGSNLGTYTPNSASKTINIGVPTKVSELTNDRGYLTQHQKFSDLIGTLGIATSDFTDGTEIVTSFASDNGFSDSNGINIPYKRKASSMWGYIKGKSDGRYLQLSGGKVGLINIATNSDGNSNNNIISCFSNKLFLQYGTAQDLVLCQGGGGVMICNDKYSSSKLTISNGDLTLYNKNHGDTPSIHFCRSDSGYSSDYTSWWMYSSAGHFYMKGGDNGSDFTILDVIKSQVYVGTNLLATGGITAYSSSDLRLKSNLHKADSLKLIKSLGTVYEFDYTRTKEHSFGLIAQNVQRSRLSDLVGKDEEGYLKLNYWSPKLISLALGGIVQVDDKVTKLKRKVKALEKEVKSLRDELNNKKEDKDNININA